MFYARLFVFACLFIFVRCVLEISIVKNNDVVPPADDAVCMARFVVHNSDWCSLAYISKNDGSTLGSPLSRIYSISDGTAGNSSGIVYFMVSPLDLTIQDLLKSNNCSVVMSLAQTHYCQMKKYDTQDPRCAQVILDGNFVFLEKKSKEIDIAKDVLWSRHPVMKTWYHFVLTHKWIFAKMEITKIAVVDMFGGRKFPSVSEYFTKNCTKYVSNFTENVHYLRNVQILN
ncbi:protein CREG1-like [Planococcus citri]|uniref:protein CREG1-like n=1 Tax=Planococcus citri TaxID=170843 RepID=UPI0031F734E0